MGTRADFYKNRPGAPLAPEDWKGSVAFDGYPDRNGRGKRFLGVTTEETFDAALAELAKEEDWTAPERGWPWPWNDSSTTDFAYAFDGGRVMVSRFGGRWMTVERFLAMSEADKDRYADSFLGKVVFPDMAAIKKLTFGKRSGLLVIEGGRSREDLE